MPEAVVDLLETIEVDEQDRGRAGGSPGRHQVELLDEAPAVAQSREVVGAGQPLGVAQGPHLAEGQ